MVEGARQTHELRVNATTQRIVESDPEIECRRTATLDGGGCAISEDEF